MIGLTGPPRLPRQSVSALLPAATTITAPAPQALSMAACIAGLSPQPPSDILIASAAGAIRDQSRPAAIAASVDPPASQRTLANCNLARGAVPETPVVLWVAAAAIPATCV